MCIVISISTIHPQRIVIIMSYGASWLGSVKSSLPRRLSLVGRVSAYALT